MEIKARDVMWDIHLDILTGRVQEAEMEKQRREADRKAGR